MKAVLSRFAPAATLRSVPDPMGRFGRKARRRRIALLLDTLWYWYQNELLLGVHEQSVQDNLDVYCLAGEGVAAADRAGAIYELVCTSNFDGVIMSTGTMAHAETDDELLTFLERFGPIPIVSVARPIQGIASIILDNISAVRDMTRHLIEDHERRNIAVVRVNSPEGAQRFEGYCLGLADHGLRVNPDLIIDGEFTWQSGVDAARSLLDQRKTSFDALVTANDWVAIGAMHEFQLRGLRVPDDVAVIGFDDIEAARFANPPLTSIRQPVRGLGAQAVNLLVELMTEAPRTSSTAPPVRRVPTHRRLRQSCGCSALQTLHSGSVRPAPEFEHITPGNNRIERWASAIQKALPDSMPRLGTHFADELATVLARDVDDQTEDSSLAVLMRALETAAQFENVPEWHDAIRVLRAQCVPELHDDKKRWLHAESLFERAHLLIAAAAERVQGQRRFEHEDVVSLLNDVSREVRNLNEDEQVLRVMVSHLPRIGVPRFYVGRQVTSSTQQPSSQLLVAHGLGSDIPVANSLTYPTGELLPGALLPQSRHTLVVLRLAFEDVPRWFYAAELGPTNGLVYESIREMLSAGLKNASLLRQVIAEVSRSERAERVRIEREMQLAQRIQCEILPKAHPVDGLEITATMVPASEVGGDYYDVLPFDRGCWLGIGDVVGHGLDTGLIMMMIQSIVAATTRSMPDESPKAIWRIVNAILYENIRNRLGRDEHATLCLLRYERDGRIVFAGAHEDLIVLRAQDRHCELVPTRGVWAGICAQFDEETVELGACQLQVGDLLILYTDGITEAMNPRCEMFGTRRLCETVQHVWDRSTREINDHVMETVLTWSNVLADDRTLVVARYTGG